jgi:hypothetical protein
LIANDCRFNYEYILRTELWKSWSIVDGMMFKLLAPLRYLKRSKENNLMFFRFDDGLYVFSECGTFGQNTRTSSTVSVEDLVIHPREVAVIGAFGRAAWRCW